MATVYPPAVPDLAPPLWELSGREPGDLALSDDRRDLSWHELDERTNAIGHGVETLGLSPGDHLVLVAGNRAEFVEVLLGGQRAGMVVTPLKTGWTPAEIDVVLDDAGTRLVVTDRDAAREAAAARQLPVLDLDEGFEEWLAAEDAGPLPFDRRGWRMSYTSGTTGRPKGVVHPWSGGSPFSESFVRGGTWSEVAGVPTDGAHLMASQLFHGAPLMFGLGALARGAPLRIMGRWDAGAFLRLAADGVASTALVPTMFRQLLALPAAERNAFSAPALRTVLHGGEPCPPDVKRRMVDWWGPVFVEYFGFTEGGLTFATTAEWLERPGTVGRALGHQDVVITDDDGRPLPAGREGRVHFRFRDGSRFAYHGDQAKTDAAHASDGSFTAGDIGWVDEDGYLYISGREAEVIVSSGVNVYPAEIEAVIDAVDGVADVAAVAAPDPERGEHVVAFVVVGSDTDAHAVVERVTRACESSLAPYKRPRRVVVSESVPRDGTGKLLRRALRDQLWAGRRGFAAAPPAS
jgi:acyl-CoA synthetase (AMP-forming)/AMP-acid ligase II